MEGLDEWPDIPSFEEFLPGWAEFLVYRIYSREVFSFPR